MSSRIARAAVSGMLAVSIAVSGGVVAPAAHAETAAEAVEIARKAANSGSSDLSSDTKGGKGGFDSDNLSSTIGLDSIQQWYNSSPEVGRNILTILAVLIGLDIVGIVLGPVRSVLFNMAGVR